MYTIAMASVSSNHLKSLLLIVVIGAVCVYLKLGNLLETTPSSTSSSWILFTEGTEGSQATRGSRPRPLTHYTSSGGNYSNGYETTGISHDVGTAHLPSCRQLNPMPETAPPNLPWMKTGLKVTPKSLMKLPWIRELWTFINTEIDGRFPVAITASNFNYRSSLVNWLAHALLKEKNSLKNVLILSMDDELHNFLRRRNISSLLVPHQPLSKAPENKRIVQVEIARLVVMRLINFWGYDVVNYDSDAFILKNPQELFDLYPGSHVIGSESYMPFDLHKKWGVTLCMGVVLIRASSETGRYLKYTMYRGTSFDGQTYKCPYNYRGHVPNEQFMCKTTSQKGIPRRCPL